MTVPVIKYDGTDITAHVVIESSRFASSANGRPGMCQIRVRDDAHAHSFVQGKEISLDLDGDRTWTGYLATVRRGYFLIQDKAPDDRERYFELIGVDLNILFHKRFLYDKVAPTNMQLTTHPPGTADDVVLLDYLANHLDLSSDGLTTSLIEHVGTPSTDAEISGAAGWSWDALMQMLTINTGAIYYIDPERQIALTDVDTPDAPFGVSDNPSIGYIGCRELEIDFGGEGLKNDVFAWGVGQGSSDPVFARVQDEPSISAHKRWQEAVKSQSIWQQATIDRVADSHVNGSPQNKRGGKDDAVAVRCAIFQPGIHAGMKVPVESGVHGYSDVIPAREVVITFPGSTSPRWDLVLSHEIDSPWTTFEYWFPDFVFPDFGGIGVPDITIPRIDIPDIRLPPFDPCACVPGTESTAGWQDDFEDRTIGLGKTTGQWGTSPEGESWSTHFTIDSLSVGGGGVQAGYGYFRLEPDNGDNEGWANIDFAHAEVLNGGTFDLTARISFNAVFDDSPSGEDVAFRIRLGVGPATDSPAQDADVEITIITDPDAPASGNMVLVDDASDFANITLQLGQEYFVRWQRDLSAGISRAKIWGATVEEPSAWTVEDAPWDGVVAESFSFVTQEIASDIGDEEYVEGRLHDLRIGTGDGSCTTVGEAMGLFADGSSEGCGTETFTRSEASGWGTSEIDSIEWTHPSGATQYSVDGDEGVIVGSSSHEALLEGVNAELPWEVEIHFQMDRVNTGVLQVLETGLFGPSYDIGSIWAGAQIRVNSGAAPVLDLNSSIGSTSSSAGIIGFGMPCVLKLRIEAGGVMAKAWELSDPEPDWHLTLSGDMSSLDGTNDFEMGGRSGNASNANRVNTIILPPCEGGNPCGTEDEPFPDPPRTGELCETLSDIATPTGGDPDSTYYETTHRFTPGSERLYLNGLLLRPGVDYTRHAVDRYVEILDSVTVDPETDEVFVCYDIYLSTPPPEIL